MGVDFVDGRRGPRAGNNRQVRQVGLYGEAYAFFGQRNSTPGTNVSGGGGDILIYKGIAVGGDAGWTVGNPDNKITILVSPGSEYYHFLCCRAERKVEPFSAAPGTAICPRYRYLRMHPLIVPIRFPRGLFAF